MSDSLDYLNLALDVFYGKPAPWFPFHRTVGYPAVIAFANLIAPHHFLALLFVIQVVVAAASGIFLLWSIRPLLVDAAYVALALILPIELFAYVSFIMTDTWVISLGAVVIALAARMAVSGRNAKSTSWLLALLVSVGVAGTLIRPSFSIVFWVALVVLGLNRRVSIIRAVFLGCLFSSLLVSAAVIDRFGYARGRFYPADVVPEQSQGDAALYDVFVRDIRERLKSGSSPLSAEEMKAAALQRAADERNQACSALPCVAHSPDLAVVIDDLSRHPEFLFMGPVPGAAIGASRFWRMLGPVWHYQSGEPTNLAQVIRGDGEFEPRLKFLAQILDDYLKRYPTVETTNESVFQALAKCPYFSPGRCLLSHGNINVSWTIWAAVESQIGSTGADVVFRAAAEGAAGAVPRATTLMFLNQLASAAFGVPWIDYDAGEMRVLPVTVADVGRVDWLPTYVDSSIAGQIRELHIAETSRGVIGFGQTISGIVATFLRPLFGLFAVATFLMTCIYSTGPQRTLLLTTLAIYAAGITAIASSLTVYVRYIDHFLIFLFVGTMLQLSIGLQNVRAILRKATAREL